MLYFISSLFSCVTDPILDKGTYPKNEDTSANELDIDFDEDGVIDIEDACPEDPLQWSDDDGDGICDEVDDHCPDDATMFSDWDGDDLCDEEDPCPTDASNLDSDGDGVCDFEDGCPNNPDESIDSDGDGICDESDDCPNTEGFVDSNNDGLCDLLDDSDGDGLSDAEEQEFGVDCLVSSHLSPDTDEDGILDSQDPFPLDPWPEFILFRNEDGRIDLMFSNRTQIQTFGEEIQIGDEYGGTENTEYRYTEFVIADFDSNGQMDFLAIGDSDPEDLDNDVDVWYFWRSKADEFHQRLLGTSHAISFSTSSDFDNDFKIDFLVSDIDRPNYINSVVLYSYLNRMSPLTAPCFATTDPTNSDGCAFVYQESVDLTDWTHDEWSYRQSRDAVDVNGDGNRDLAIMKISGGGNDSNVPISVIFGDGAGGFSSPPVNPLFSHNTLDCGDSPANSILFADFNMDGTGDVIVGLDDDGDAGSAWLYPGNVSQGPYLVDMNTCFESFDIAQTYENGQDNPGVSSSARNFDFDFDGYQDVIVGYRNENAWTGDSRTVLLFGDGTGSFGPQHIIREYEDSNLGHKFATPQRICTWFPLAEVSDNDTIE